MCRFLYSWHRSLTDKYEQWALERLSSNQAAKLSIDNISGTEWPLFGSVFYLLATESLQNAWEKDNQLCSRAPAEYAEGAIRACTKLVTDPVHATWVKKHWGDDYLKSENLFYRMLLIHSMISYQKLLNDNHYEPLLRQQVDTLARELDQSPFGLLDDYPGQCYPVDIMPAYAAIAKADKLLRTNHSAIIERGIRAFQDNRVDPSTGLPAYNADSETGYRLGTARGVGISFMLIWCPELWPAISEQWYSNYEQHFWQENRYVCGFLEFPKSFGKNKWEIEVDAGPVLGGYGVGASAFGIGAARANSRMDHAYQLSALALAGAWRLPDGTMPVPRLLSDAIDAPYLGESAFLFCLTRVPVLTSTRASHLHTPLIVYFVLGTALLIGIVLVVSSLREIKRTWTGIDPYVIPLPRTQLLFRIVLLCSAIVVFTNYGILFGYLTVIAAFIFPYIQKKRRNTGNNEQLINKETQFVGQH